MNAGGPQRAGGRRRALAHQCPDCRRHWALHAVDHPVGIVVVCRYCRAVRDAHPLIPDVQVADPGRAGAG